MHMLLLDAYAWHVLAIQHMQICALRPRVTLYIWYLLAHFIGAEKIDHPCVRPACSFDAAAGCHNRAIYATREILYKHLYYYT